MSLKNLNATIKIPKKLKKELTNLRINKIYNIFEKNFVEHDVVAMNFRIFARNP